MNDIELQDLFENEQAQKLLENEQAEILQVRFKKLAYATYEQTAALPERQFLSAISHLQDMNEIQDLVKARLEYIMIHDDASRLSRLPIWKLSAFRIPALFLTLAFELSVGIVISFYHPTLRKHLLLASFMPILSAISGNIGLQASTATLRALAMGYASGNTLQGAFKIFIRESMAAFLIAIVLGPIIMLISYIWSHSIVFGLVTGTSLLISSSLAGFIGSFAPVLFKRFNIDPAITAGPFETALQDIIGTTTYLTLATLFLM